LQVWPYGRGIKSKLAPVNLLRKLFFRRYSPWVQRDKTIVMVWSVVTRLVMAGTPAGVLLAHNTRH
jgi:hypothetical protein